VNVPEDPGPNREFEARTKQAFDESVSRLDARTRSRLTQARYAALAQVETHLGTRAVQARRYWMPAVGLAAAAVLAVVMMPSIRSQKPVATLAEDDMPLLLDSDNVEMLEELEFYAWLDEAAFDATTTDDTGVRPADPARS